MGLLILSISFSQFLIFSCEGINCAIDNVVTLNMGFYDENDTKKAITDTLTVTAEGTDSVLYNRGINITSLSLPMSHWQEADTLTMTFRDTLGTDHIVKLRIEKTNLPHYESPDCPTAMFHEIKSVTMTSGSPYVDSVVLAKPKVNYEALENVKIYLHPTD
ncbi:MAG: hypothetical protein J5671_00825 [Bacteroidaceae bacterium]|nr:hypothetical protein [Bacteroidaceae bacterium]